MAEPPPATWSRFKATDPLGPIPAPVVPSLNAAGFEVLEVLGRGGMGVVYKARQKSLNRVVAVKMLLAGGQADRDTVARFKTEAEAVARLQHPNIVQIHEVGEGDGQRYFCLEFVDGGSLADLLDGTPATPGRAAELVEVVARAVQYAHERGVLHRDLKPANILLASGGREPPERSDASGVGPPLAFFTPKLTDFGLARFLDRSERTTKTGGTVGTPSYMAPEQATGGAVGPWTDVYALGAVLYEMLTGRPPFKAETPLETVLQVVGEEPVTIRRLQPKVPRDLETVCLKCLEKEPKKRYASAAELADDLRRFLDGEPVRGRPVPAWERGARWARRRPAVAALIASTAAAVVLGLAGVTLLWQRAELRQREAESARAQAAANADAERLAREEADAARQAEAAARAKEETARKQTEEALAAARQANVAVTEARRGEAEKRGQAEAALERAENYLYAFRIGHAAREWAAGNRERAEQVLAQCPPRLRQWEWHYLTRQCRAHPTSVVTLARKAGEPAFARAAFSADGSRLVVSLLGVVKVHRADTGEELRSVWGNTSAASADGGRVAAAEGKKIKLVDASSGEVVRTLDGHAGRVNALGFSPDGTRLLSAGAVSADQADRRGEWKVWDAASGEVVRTRPMALTNSVVAAFSPDGKRLALASGSAVIVEDLTADTRVTLGGHARAVTALAFSPDGKRLATADSGNDDASRTVRVWDAGSGKVLWSAEAPPGPVGLLGFAPGGNLLVAAAHLPDSPVAVWDAGSGRPAHALRGHDGAVRALAFSRDGRLLVTAGDDRTARVWDLPTGRAVRVYRDHTQPVTGVNFSPDGRLAVSLGGDEVRVWELFSDYRPATLGGHAAGVERAAFSPDGKRLAAACWNGEVRLWDVADGRDAGVLRGHAGVVYGVAYHPDGTRLATAAEDRDVKVWDANTAKEVLTLPAHEEPVRDVAFSPDGKRLATASGYEAKLWDAATGKAVRTLGGHPGTVRRLAFSPDGKRLAVGSWQETRLWDLDAGKSVALAGHGAAVPGVAFSADGTRLATAGADGEVRVWDAATGRLLHRLVGHGNVVVGIAFDPECRRLVSASGQEVRVWDLATGEELLVLRGHAGKVRGVAFSGDGRLLATAGEDKAVKVWDATPLAGAAPNP